VADSSKRGPRSGVNLPLPPPASESDDPISRVRMSGLVSDHTGRAVPALPVVPWDIDDTTDEDRPNSAVLTSARIRDEPEALVAARRAERQTLAGVRSARRLPLTADESAPVPLLPELDEPHVVLAPKLPAPPTAAPPRLPGPPAPTDSARLPLRASPRTPPVGNVLPTIAAQGASARSPLRPLGPVPPRAAAPTTSRPIATSPQTASAPLRPARVVAAPPVVPSSAAPSLRSNGDVSPSRDGRIISGRYQIIERIGVGGMGKVYKVSHTQLSKTFALKVIGENLANTEEARELFYREARLASAVNHPNITSVVDFGEDPEVGAFMVMELVEGESVHRVLRRETRLGVRLACEIILQVADALHYVHSQGIVHCDIKTENILIAEQAGTKRRQIVVKLLDFGLARSLTGGRSSGPLSGTPHYVSPERIRGDAATPSSDLYALGILFYELITGNVPWDGAVSNILSGHLDQQPAPPSKAVPGLDPALEKLILRALAKSPAERHKDMAAFIYELRTVMDMLGFGHRRRGGGKRVVIERSKNERDALAARLVDGCRLPLALVSRDGVILVANPACARFVMGVVVEIEGLPLAATPLAGVWSTLEADLTRAAGASPIRRILEIDVPNGSPQRLLVWLDPCGDGVLFGVQPLE
jgi:tRNA A-37 threonylcarbamoyl transferase component Bud32